MATIPLSTQERFQNAWGILLSRFRDWSMADTREFAHWKSRPIKEAIHACAGRMIDDAEAMLDQYRRNDNVKDTPGSTAILPVMLTAFEPMASIPDASSVRGVPYWLNIQVPTDPDLTTARMRTIPTAIRAQVAFFTPTPHTAFSMASQFAAFLTDEYDRQLPLKVDLGGGITDTWQLTVLDNTLFPSRVPTEAKNLTIVTVDVTLAGLVPHVVGLGGEWDATTDPVNTASPPPGPIIEADVLTEGSAYLVRWVADVETGETTLVSLTAAQVLQLESGEILQLEDGRYLRIA